MKGLHIKSSKVANGNEADQIGEPQMRACMICISCKHVIMMASDI